MSRRSWVLCVAVAVVSVAVLAADDPKPAASAPENEDPAVKECRQACRSSDAACNSDVRRARTECSRNAANGGREPFSQYRPYDYSYFCTYFNNPNRCTNPYDRSGCQSRYQVHYGHCVDAMRYNIAAMRYDCFQNERDATNVCRAELRQCQAACGR